MTGRRELGACRRMRFARDASLRWRHPVRVHRVRDDMDAGAVPPT
ncbi:hypothetical protein ACFW1A_14290 [Kitasatospora sp. NPDC058965]